MYSRRLTYTWATKRPEAPRRSSGCADFRDPLWIGRFRRVGSYGIQHTYHPPRHDLQSLLLGPGHRLPPGFGMSNGHQCRSGVPGVPRIAGVLC